MGSAVGPAQGVLRLHRPFVQGAEAQGPEVETSLAVLDLGEADDFLRAHRVLVRAPAVNAGEPALRWTKPLAEVPNDHKLSQVVAADLHFDRQLQGASQWPSPARRPLESSRATRVQPIA
jgi:hypothetical protein